MSSKPIVKILAAIGALILLVGSWIHSDALSSMRTAIAPMDDGFFRDALPGMWVMPSVHWILIACLSFGLSFYKSKAGAVILIAFGVLLLLDAALVYRYVGAFAGVYMLIAAGVLILTSGILLRRSMQKGS